MAENLGVGCVSFLHMAKGYTKDPQQLEQLAIVQGWRQDVARIAAILDH